MKGKAKPAANRGCYEWKNNAGEQQVIETEVRALREKDTGSKGEVTKKRQRKIHN